nr:protein SIEVE ELEMENT OCCLUSION B-like [Ziziphus jujuba var. spinosa]
MKDDEEYRNLIRIFESSHLDNSKVIRALLSPKNESKVLVIGNDMEKRPVSIDVLRRKHVLLIISDLNLPSKEIEVVVNVYGMRHDIQCEMVWIPVVGKLNGWQEQNQYKFAELQAVMPWYTVTTPLVIEPTVIRYIKEYWNFDKKRF